MKIQKLTAGLLTAAAGMSLASTGHAQSVDALLDKLVDKGVLSVKEAQELREDSDKGFNTALSAKMGLPDWVTGLKFTGDVRGRYEYFDSENAEFVERDRFRYRVRFGFIATFMDDFEAGSGYVPSEQTGGSGGNAGAFGGDPISGNTTFQDNGSKKFVYLDLAYGKWTPLKGPHLMGSATIGKMENPFVFSDMVFDGDYTPEGAAIQTAYRFNDVHTARLNLGGFVLDESGGDRNDPFLIGAQARWDALWSPKFQTTFGAAWLGIGNDEVLTTASVPNMNRGNTRGANTLPATGFDPFVLDASATYTWDKAPFYTGPFPIKVGGDYINNCNASGGTDKYGYSAGVTFGKSGKRKTWELGYTYKWLGADAWWEELVDSDFGAFYANTVPPGGNSHSNSGLAFGYGAGTNVKGHIVRFAYSPADALTLSVKWFRTELINEFPAGTESGTDRIQVDAVWKF